MHQTPVEDGHRLLATAVAAYTHPHLNASYVFGEQSGSPFLFSHAGRPTCVRTLGQSILDSRLSVDGWRWLVASNAAYILDKILLGARYADSTQRTGRGFSDAYAALQSYTALLEPGTKRFGPTTLDEVRSVTRLRQQAQDIQRYHIEGLERPAITHIHVPPNIGTVTLVPNTDTRGVGARGVVVHGFLARRPRERDTTDTPISMLPGPTGIGLTPETWARIIPAAVYAQRANSVPLKANTLLLTGEQAGDPTVLAEIVERSLWFCRETHGVGQSPEDEQGLRMLLTHGVKMYSRSPDPWSNTEFWEAALDTSPFPTWFRDGMRALSSPSVMVDVLEGRVDCPIWLRHIRGSTDIDRWYRPLFVAPVRLCS